jgi:hypothetical protein
MDDGPAGAGVRLDLAAAREAGRPHGQLVSAVEGGLVLSAHKLVEIGARALLLIVPGVFRFDARPEEDSLQVMTRALGAQAPLWEAVDNPPEAYGDERSDAPYRAGWRFAGAGLEGRVELITTLDLAAGARHFALHAVVRERDRMPGRRT